MGDPKALEAACCDILNSISPLLRSYANDPILQYRPDFARSLPVQLLVTGAVLTLVGVLFIHLLFTTQYHWPLAPVNYVLQMSSVITLLVSLIATVHVILNTAKAESAEWPYGFSYISVAIPPLSTDELKYVESWTTAEMAAWLLMNATTSGLIQITHIQFLTLLYPSPLERKLILFLLGPLALLSAIMQLLPIHSNAHIVAFADIISNVCNATLSLLFTAALFLWGLYVNRRRAWRTDGGTAAFGAGACVLALVSTILTFVYIPSKDQQSWLPGLILSVVLWQSFLGWWWWVGAGMDAGSGEARMLREEKRRRKRRERRARREERTKAVKGMWSDVAHVLHGWHLPGQAAGLEEEETEAENNGRGRGQGREKEPTPAPSLDEDRGEDGVARVSGREVPSPDPQGSNSRHRSLEVSSEPPRPSMTTTTVLPTTTTGLSATGPLSGSSTSGETISTHTPGFVPAVQRTFTRLVSSIRREHRLAARQLAAEQTARMQEVYGVPPPGHAAPDSPAGVGWGLGAFGMRERRARDERLREGREGVSGLLEEEEGAAVVAREGGLLKEGEAPAQVPGGMWWWGPLRRWRLQDTTDYR